MVKVPYKRADRVPGDIMPTKKVEPIDIPGFHEPVEGKVKKILCRMIDWCIEQLLKIKARLRQPLKAADMSEIEEE